MMMMDKILAMVENIACASADVWEDEIMDIVINDSDMFSWDESPELINLLEYLESSCEIHESSYGYDEYHFSDGLIIAVYSESYED